MRRAAIDLPWHDAVVHVLDVLDEALQHHKALDMYEGLLSKTRDTLHTAVTEFDFVHQVHAQDSIYPQLFDALAYFNEALRMRPIGQAHLERVHEILFQLRDLAIPY